MSEWTKEEKDYCKEMAGRRAGHLNACLPEQPDKTGAHVSIVLPGKPVFLIRYENDNRFAFLKADAASERRMKRECAASLKCREHTLLLLLDATAPLIGFSRIRADGWLPSVDTGGLLEAHDVEVRFINAV